MKIIIKKTESSSFPEILEIENSSFSQPWSREAFESSLANPLVDIFSAFCEMNGREVLCGYMVIMTLPPDCEILNIAVSKKFRRMGIAEKMIEFACVKAKKACCEQLMLEVRESNTPARNLYEKMGFYPVGIRKKYYREPTEDAILMNKNL